MEEKKIVTKAVLVGLNCTSDRYADYNSDDDSIDELAALLETAGGEAVALVLQNKETPEKSMLVGEGKVEQISDLVHNCNAQLVVFDNPLSPSQIKNLEDRIGVSVIDRSMLILEIFAMHATTREGKLQVAMAQLKYTAPRLTGKGAQMSRLGGGGGGGGGARRGAGETKLETDRRKVKEQIAAIRAELDDMKQNKLQQRKQRDLSGTPKVAVIGYTNAGKSTLLNTLTGAGVLAENKLFATLDPTTRKLKMENGFEVLVTDTVGFIKNLPHHLVEAFASTLDEVKYADLLINVVDVSNPQFLSHIEVTEKLVADLGAGALPMITALNKSDIVGDNVITFVKDGIAISAKTGMGLDKLLTAVYEKLTQQHKKAEYMIPYSAGALLDEIYSDVKTTVVNKEFTNDGVYLELFVTGRIAGLIERYKI